ncbi:MAG: monovalent cation:proton antiporter-2 (CPA2) family protein [Myxococcota bacterium]
MTPDSFLAQALVYLGAAVIAVPIASRLGLGSVLGYLLAGVAVGPWGVGFVAEESRTVMHFAEFGVVMMLFLVGLELDPARLWRLRGPVLGLGGLQVGGTAVAMLPIGWLLGLPWQQGLALGLAVAMSSTAIALQTLTEKGLNRSEAGQVSFAVLLFQDLSVIPILALFPLLATAEVLAPGESHGSAGWIDGLPGWQRAAVVLGAVAAVIAIGRVGVGPALRRVAQTGLREMFTAASLLIVVGVAALMSAVGLSAALGAFVAGVVLANSEYRHELVSDVEPFKGLLLGLFFVAVGASIDFGWLVDRPLHVGGLVGAVIAVKLGVLLAVARVGRLSIEQALTFAVVLSQVGEFAFVLFGVAAEHGVLPADVTGPMTAVTAFSMACTPLLLSAVERFVLPRLARAEPPTRPADAIDESNEVIVAGYGRFGQIVGRLLRACGHGVTVLDIDSDQVDLLRRFGQKVFYGDASRIELLHAAGAHQARVLVVAVDEPEKVDQIVHIARKHFPNLAILARARGRTEAYELLEAGVAGTYRETFDTALRAGEDALRLLGLPAHAAHRAARTFRQHDERVLRELAAHRHDEQTLAVRARERLRDFEQLMTAERAGALTGGAEDHGWDSEVIREAILSADRPKA